MLVVGCVEPNDRVDTIKLRLSDTYTRVDTLSKEVFTLQFDGEAGRLVRFRAWSIGVLAGLEIVVRDPNDEVVYQDTSLGTELRIDALEVLTSGLHTVQLRWLEGNGVSAYRYDVIGVASQRLVVQPRLSLDTPIEIGRAHV